MQKTNALTEIKKQLSSMFEIERKIGEYILANAEKAVNMTVARIAAEAQVSEGSIIRFANKIGFEGFTRLKINIAQNLKNGEVLFSGRKNNNTVKSAMEDMKQQILYSVENTIIAANEESLKRIAEILMKSKRTEFYGVGSSSMIANDAYYRFLRIGLPVYAVTDAHISSVSAFMLNENCAAVGISYSGKSQETLKAMETSKKRGAKTIGITAYSGSPLAKLCDETIISVAMETKTYNEATAARIAQLMVIDSLCLYISQRRKNSLEIMGNIIDIIGEHRV